MKVKEESEKAGLKLNIQKTKNRANVWSSNPTSGHISGENHNFTRYINPNDHRRTIYNSQDMQAT